MIPLVDSRWLAERVGGGLWRHVQTIATTGSTNADLAAAAREGAPGGSVLVSDHQSSGRGRFERVWEAPPGSSVALSVLLRPPNLGIERWLWLPLITGLAVSAAVRSLGVSAGVKWPNDVLLPTGKVCGILSERVETPTGPAAVIGMGINTTLSEVHLPVPTATSLSLAGCTAPVGEVVAAVLVELEGLYRSWESGADLREEFAAGCLTVGREVRVEVSPSDQVSGRAIGVDAQGCLLVETAAGVRSFAAGDVWHLR